MPSLSRSAAWRAIRASRPWFRRPIARRSGRQRRIALVGSSGGHLLQLFVLAPAWADTDHFWVTFETADALSLLASERTSWCYFPTNRSLKNLVRNTWLALRILRNEHPTHVVSTGAAVAVPFFYLGRLFGAQLIYIEVIDRVETATITGRLIRPVAHHLLVQWPEQLALYRRAELLGPVL